MRTHCPYCQKLPDNCPTPARIVRLGRYWRKSDGHWIQRFSCKRCKKSFSRATFSDCYRQKKRHKNETLRKLLCGGVSQREAARVLKLNRKTVVRKFLFLAQKESVALKRWNKAFPPSLEVEFDDLETFEHTKCKPIAVTMMVEDKTRRILGFEVASMAAKGLLSARARKKYGFRKDDRRKKRRKLFAKMQNLIHPQAQIRSDSNPYYLQDVRDFFPHARYERVLGARGAITGQGELKKIKFDPIFSLNHTFAMLRANINRLFRKTWCTTKKIERLEAHLALYAMSHNRRLSTA